MPDTNEVMAAEAAPADAPAPEALPVVDPAPQEPAQEPAAAEPTPTVEAAPDGETTDTAETSPAEAEAAPADPTEPVVDLVVDMDGPAQEPAPFDQIVADAVVEPDPVPVAVPRAPLTVADVREKIADDHAHMQGIVAALESEIGNIAAFADVEAHALTNRVYTIYSDLLHALSALK